MTVTATQLQGLYLAYFGRPADTDGLTFYTSHSNMTLWDVAQAFSASPESQRLFAGSTPADVIDSIYMNLFNRHAEAGGIAYWTGEIESGRLTAGEAAYGILIGAQNEDMVTIANKLASCGAFTDVLGNLSAPVYVGDAAASYARSFIHAVDGTQAAAAAGVGLAGDCVAAMASDLSPAGSMQVVADALHNDYLETGKGSAGIVLSQGLSWNDHSTIGDVQSGQTIEVDGPGGSSNDGLTLQDFNDTPSDLLQLKLNPDFGDNNDTASVTGMSSIYFDMQKIEHVRIESTGRLVSDLSQKASGWQPDNVLNHVLVSDDSMQSIVVTGDQPIELDAQSTALRIIDASALHAAPQLALAPYHAAFSFSANLDGPNETIIGSLDSSNWIQGSYGADLITGGSQADTLTGAGGGDTLTGGGGNDVFAVGYPGQVAIDTITDFHANTVGNAAGGGADSTGAAAAALRSGDVINLASASLLHTIAVTVAPDSSQALQQIAGGDGTIMKAALDSSTGMLYVDWDGNGSVDAQVELVGVKTITAAAFLMHSEFTFS